MAAITKGIRLRIKKSARQLAGKDQFDFEDAESIGLYHICTMDNGYTESYYAQKARWSMQNYLRKIRKERNREIYVDGIENLSESAQYGKKSEFGIKTPCHRYEEEQ